jgi:D-sedoheptulose 7-phosphate isomerase
MNTLDNFYSEDPAHFANSYLDYLGDVLSKIDRHEIAGFIRVLLQAQKKSSSVFFIGNGGSASTASHFANDLTLGTNSYSNPFRVMSLVDNAAILTAIGNDFGYEEIFVRQLKILGKPGDVLVAISASGNSPNLVKSIEYANQNGIETVSLTSFDGGIMRNISKYSVHVPTPPKEYGPAEDAHLVIDHLVTAYLSRLINGIK